MHILLVHQYFLEKDDAGGSRFNEMAAIWEKQGHKITVIAGMVHYTTGKKRPQYKGKFIVKNQYSDNITVWRCHVSEAYNSSFLGRMWGYFSFVISGTLAGIFRAREHYDVVLATSPPLFVGIIGYLSAKIKRIPLVFEVRDLWPESAIDTGILRNQRLIKCAYRFEKFIYKKATLINALTPAFVEKIHRKGVPIEKLTMIPNAADFDSADKGAKYFDPKALRLKFGISDQELLIIYVGAHGVANHLIQLVDVAEALQSKKVKFLCLGEGMEKDMLKAEVRKRALTNILFLDAVPKSEVYKYIFASDIGTSVLKKVDTFKTVYSNKTFDYMACQKPIIMAIDGVSRKLVEDAQAGFYAEPENTQMFINAVEEYLKNPSLIELHGQNGYNYAKAHFDRKVLADKYLNALKGLNK